MNASSPSALRLDLLMRLAEGRRETDELFGILKPEVLYDRPIAERHRIVFYIGHLEAFDWNLLRTHLQLDRFHPEFDQLFAFGIDPVDGELPSDQPKDWPSMTQVETYRKHIRQELDAALADVDETDELVQLLNIAIEHRLMHAETLEYMFHQLPFEAKIRPQAPTLDAAGQAMAQMISIPAGKVTLGLDRGSEQFGWDNEFEAFAVDVPAFSIDKHKVTNGQFAEFVSSGGYREQRFWSPADWEWRSATQVFHPVFWIPAGESFEYKGMFEQGPLPFDAPVYVSHAEASAYARWLGKSLPTEAEWQRAAEGAAPPAEMRVLWDAPPVGSSPALASNFGLEDLYGSAWEWTSSQFAPFSGFRAHPAYPGYSANFFDGKHFVMKGGSVRTASCMLRKTFRNWFQAHYQYVYAGFRCVTH
jgi:ergothioneine biosynthesis protein EgtB